MTSSSSESSSQEILTDLKNLINEAESLLNGPVSAQTGGAVTTLRDRLEAAQGRLSQACGCATQRLVDGAKYADTAVRDHPYPALAIAGGVGLLVGVLIGRKTV